MKLFYPFYNFLLLGAWKPFKILTLLQNTKCNPRRTRRHQLQWVQQVQQLIQYHRLSMNTHWYSVVVSFFLQSSIKKNVFRTLILVIITCIESFLNVDTTKCEIFLQKRNYLFLISIVHCSVIAIWMETCYIFIIVIERVFWWFEQY